MKIKTICRILAYIGLACAVAFTVSLCILLFNLDSESMRAVLNPLTLVLFVATLIFLIPAYVLNKKVTAAEETAARSSSGEEQEDEDAPAKADVDGSLPAAVPDGEKEPDESSRAADSADGGRTDGPRLSDGASVSAGEADGCKDGENAGGGDVRNTKGEKESGCGEQKSGGDKPLGV